MDQLSKLEQLIVTVFLNALLGNNNVSLLILHSQNIGELEVYVYMIIKNPKDCDITTTYLSNYTFQKTALMNFTCL